jgi:5-methylcytosine-specific restriction protein B
MIPHNITRKHILQALEKIDQDGVPPNRSARGYELRYLEKRYPPKYVVAVNTKIKVYHQT